MLVFCHSGGVWKKTHCLTYAFPSLTMRFSFFFWTMVEFMFSLKCFFMFLAHFYICLFGYVSLPYRFMGVLFFILYSKYQSFVSYLCCKCLFLVCSFLFLYFFMVLFLWRVLILFNPLQCESHHSTDVARLKLRSIIRGRSRFCGLFKTKNTTVFPWK